MKEIVTIVDTWLNDNQIEYIKTYKIFSRWNNKKYELEFAYFIPRSKIFLELYEPSSETWKSEFARSKLWLDLIKFMIVKRDLPEFQVIYLSDNITLKLGQIFLKNPHSSQESLRDLFIEIKIINPEQAKQFLINYHYLGFTAGTYYGGLIANKLEFVCVISNPTRQNIKSSIGECKELTRLAVSPNAIRNIISFSIAKICKIEKQKGTKAIVTFADPTPYRKNQHTGAVYKACNFNFVGYTTPNYCYTNKEGELIHKKTVYNRAKKIEVTEKCYRDLYQLFKVPEWPKLKFEKIL